MKHRPALLRRCRGARAAVVAAAATVLASVTMAVAASAVAPAVGPRSPNATTTSTTTTTTTTTTASSIPGYWLVASDGGVFSFGGLGFYGSTGSMTLNKPVVGMAPTADSRGYWLVASDGGIFTFGDAVFHGSTGALRLNKPVVGMAPSPDGGGYWLVASDGGIFTFGDAHFFGSAGSLRLNEPVVGMAPTPDGRGYWLVASDGGIFAYGDAHFFGSTGNITLNSPIVGMSTTADGLGYSFVAADGGIFAYGDSHFYGSLGGEPLKRPIVSLADIPSGAGYWMTDDNGAVSAFGSAGYFGSAPQVLRYPVVNMVEAAGTGSAGGLPYQSGAYGYDISNYQCNQPLPSGHAIGIVQVVGASFAPTNPCLSSEATWAGGGLNLYIFLTYGTTATGPPSCNDDTACNDGFAAAEDAYAKATAAGVDTQVTWWLDVEGAGMYWSSNTAENAQMVMGAIAGLRAEGINNVGIYASPGSWNGIVGSYQPAVPYWMALWMSPPSGPGDCAEVAQMEAQNKLPTGPVEVVQYSDDVNGFDGDYAC